MNEIKPFNDLESLSKEDIRDYIDKVQEKMLTMDNQLELPVKHHFSKGVYAREMFIPKGTYVVGKIHKHQNLNILSSGDLSVISIDGIKRVKAPYTIVSPPGVKRLAYAHEDCVWTSIHGTDETDVDKIEELFIAKTYDEVISIEKEENLCLGDT